MKNEDQWWKGGWKGVQALLRFHRKIKDKSLSQMLIQRSRNNPVIHFRVDLTVHTFSLFFPPFAQQSSVFSSTSATECSRPCCAWLEFQAPTLREGSTVPYLPCRQCSLVGYGKQLLALSLDSGWIGVAALPGHVWNGAAVMYCGASNLIYDYLWKTSLQCVR